MVPETIEIEHPKPTEDLLTKIVDAAQQQETLEDEVAKLEEEVKNKKKQLEDIQVNILPELMQKARLKTFEDEEGMKIEIDPGFHCKIPKQYHAEAMQWLEDNDLSKIIKRNIVINFDKEDENLCEELLKDLEKKEQLNIKQEKDVHHQTLKAQVKKIIQDGKLSIPRTIFGIYDRPVSIITHKQ